MLINGKEKVRNNKLQNPKAFIDYLQTIDYVCENLEDYNPSEERKVLIVFDDIIADVEVTELFLKDRKLNISLVFVSKSYFKVPKTVRLNHTLFYHEITKQKRTPRNIIKSFF